MFKIRTHFLAFAVIVALLLSCGKRIPQIQKADELDQYNVVWHSPSKDYNGSMPIGNGDIGLNVWVDESGNLNFFIGKTDSWGDNGRLLKVGRVRVQFDPPIVFANGNFEQTLDLKSGRIIIHSKGLKNGKEVDIHLQLWVDALHPVIHISHRSSVPLQMTAHIERWRTHPDTLPSIEVSDLLEDPAAKNRVRIPVVVEPDHLLKKKEGRIGWYHFNKKSVGFKFTNKLQGLSEFFKQDPILHRIFGAIIKGTQAKCPNDSTLKTSKAHQGRIDVFVLTEHPSDVQTWRQDIEKQAEAIERIPFNNLLRAHKKWWADFWNRSWIYSVPAENREGADSSEVFIVAKGYNLQRFINACEGRGRYPIKFNGSIFTVPAESKPGGPDFRRWGPGYWWQNTRLPYTAMCAAGDFDLMQPFFKMYTDDVYPLCKFRTKKYFGFDGAYFPECIYFWGSVVTGTYGWEPFEKRKDKLQESGWHKWEWIAGPELVFMMQDYFDYTGDVDFLKKKIIPIANDVIRFFNNFYHLDKNGKLLMHPAQSAETWWDCTNPMPELAGLYAITKRLLRLPTELTTTKNREFWKAFMAKLPDLPLRKTPSGLALAPASRYAVKNNIENPELYAVFPFRLFGIGRPHLDWAVNALKYRLDKGNFGWRQDDIFMAYLGLTEQARRYLVGRARKHDPKMRFPAFWGPNYDWTPDQCHGSVLMKTFQSMLLQADPYSRKLYILPAWPKDWNVDFKLHAPYRTVIEGSVRNGRLKALKVSPAERKKDIVIFGQDHTKL